MIVESAIYRPAGGGATPVGCHELERELASDPRSESGVSLQSDTPGVGADANFAIVTLDNPDTQQLAEYARALHIHPLAIDDAGNPDERPKIDLIGDTLTISMKAAKYNEADESVAFVHTTAMLGERFALIVRLYPPDAKISPPDPVAALPIAARNGRRKPADSPSARVLAHLEQAIESFTPVVDEIERDVTQIEEDVFSAGSSANSKRIYLLLRQVLAVQRAATPMVDVCERIGGPQGLDLPDWVAPHIADLLDSIHDVADRLGTERALLDSALGANLTQIGIRQNEDMRKISAWAALAAVPTMIAGIYGMNFRFMPELENRWGYPLILAIMLLCCLVLYRTFKRNGWL